PTSLTVYGGSDQIMSMSAGKHRDSASVPNQGLADRVISLKAANTETPICSDRLLHLLAAETIPPGQSHVDFATSGQVANGLNTGGTAATATGSLGARIVSYAQEGQDTTRFL